MQDAALLAGQERRVTNRLSACWESLREGAGLPHQETIGRAKEFRLSDLWESCFIVSVEQIAEGANNYTYMHLGSDIRTAYTKDVIADGEGPPLVSPRASRLHRAYRQLIETRRPVLFEGEFVSSRGQVVKYRQCLMPFVNTRNEVSAILGGMRFKLDAGLTKVAA